LANLHLTLSLDRPFFRSFSFGVTRQTPDHADTKAIPADNPGHWCIENSCHWVSDWNHDEDRGRISKGQGPENISRLRRFTVGLLKSKGVTNVAQKMRQLVRNIRPVLDYFGMTQNSRTGRSRNLNKFYGIRTK
jgi:hypothetical protein